MSTKVNNYKTHHDRLKTLCTLDTADINLDSWQYVDPRKKNKKIIKNRKNSGLKYQTPCNQGIRSKQKYYLSKEKIRKNNISQIRTQQSPKKHKTSTKQKMYKKILKDNKNKSLTQFQKKVQKKSLAHSAQNHSHFYQKKFNQSLFKNKGIRNKNTAIQFTHKNINSKINGVDQYRLMNRIYEDQHELIDQVYQINLQSSQYYIMKRNKNIKMMKQYLNQIRIQQQINLKQKSKNNLLLPLKWYKKKINYALFYQYFGSLVTVNDSLSVQIRLKSYINTMILHLAQSIKILSLKGWVHGNISKYSIRIETDKDNLNVYQAIKLTEFGHAFNLHQKKQLLKIGFRLNVPPELINYYKFANKLSNYNRQMLDYITNYNEPYQIDIWSLGILILELLNGQSLYHQTKQNQNDVNYQNTEMINLLESKLDTIVEQQLNILHNYEFLLEQVHPKIKLLIIKMLSINPYSRPKPNEVIKQILSI